MISRLYSQNFASDGTKSTRIREWLELKFGSAIPGFVLGERELDQLAGAIHTESHLKQFQEAASRQSNPRGWIVFVKIALSCQEKQGTYEQAAAGAGEESAVDREYRERMERIKPKPPCPTN